MRPSWSLARSVGVAVDALRTAPTARTAANWPVAKILATGQPHRRWDQGDGVRPWGWHLMDVARDKGPWPAPWSRGGDDGHRAAAGHGPV